MSEYHVINAIAISCRTFHQGQQGRRKATRIRDYCRKNGHTLKWCRKKMRDEEIRKVRFDKFCKKNITPIENNSTGCFNRRPQTNQTMNHFLDLDDTNNSTEELPSDNERN